MKPPSGAEGSNAPAASKPSPSDPTPSPVSLDLATEPADVAASSEPAPPSKAEVEQVDEFEEAFFSSLPPEHLAEAAPHEDDDEPQDAHMARLSMPAVVARRDRMRKRVAWGLAGCAAVFFLAVGRSVLQSEPEPAPHVEQARTEPAPLVAPAEPVAPPAPVESSAAAPAVSAAPALSAAPAASAEQPASAASAAPVESVASAAPVASAAVAPAASAEQPAPAAPAASVASAAAVGSGEEGKALRKQAQRLLDAGKAKDAIAPALESTQVEPEHALGWLLLGSAYQERGRHAEARQAFVSCVAQAKRGPRGECVAMVR